MRLRLRARLRREYQHNHKAKARAQRQHLGQDKLTPSVDPATVFARDMAGYVFNAGFCHQQWADVQVSFFGTSLRLHRREWS